MTGNVLYNLVMVIWGTVYDCFSHNTGVSMGIFSAKDQSILASGPASGLGGEGSPTPRS